MINQFRKSNSLWFYEQVDKKITQKQKCPFYTIIITPFIVNNKMNSDPQQKGCIKVPEGIDLFLFNCQSNFCTIFLLEHNK